MAERPEDLNLPNSVVARIIKDAIPDGVNVSKESRLAISKAASVFVLYATSCANTFALKAKRKTISAQDVLSAMEDMEFEQFVEPLKHCLEAFRKGLQEKKMSSERRKKEREQTVEETDENQEEQGEGEEVIAIDDDDDSGAGAEEDVEEMVEDTEN